MAYRHWEWISKVQLLIHYTTKMKDRLFIYLKFLVSTSLAIFMTHQYFNYFDSRHEPAQLSFFANSTPGGSGTRIWVSEGLLEKTPRWLYRVSSDKAHVCRSWWSWQNQVFDFLSFLSPKFSIKHIFTLLDNSLIFSPIIVLTESFASQIKHLWNWIENSTSLSHKFIASPDEFIKENCRHPKCSAHRWNWH